MKCLTLSSLLLSAVALATLGAQTAQAEYFCALATIDSDSSVNIEGGKEKIGDTCSLVGGKKFTLSATSPTPRSSGAATLTMVRSTFKEGAMLWYFAGDSNKMSNTSPINLRISGNTFERNAVLVFQGSFPQDSNIEIRGNTWVGITSAHATYGVLGAHAIMFYDGSTQRLQDRATIRIVENTIPVTVSSAGYAITVQSPFAMSVNSYFEVSDNDLSCRSAAANSYFPATIGWAYTQTLGIEGSNTSLIINNNKIFGGTDAMGILLPTINTNGNSFNLNITNNAISLEGVSHYPVRSRGLSLGGSSRVFINSNTMSSMGSSDSRILMTSMSIGGSSVVQISSNKLSAYGGNAVISFEQAAQIAGTSQLSVEFNDIFRTDDFPSGVPGIQFINSFAMSGSSVTSISYNNFNAAGRPHYMIASQGSTTKNAPAKLFLCNNVHYGSVLTSYDAYFSSGFFNAMENQTLCLARTTAAPSTTTTTTQAPSTSGPTTTSVAPTEGTTLPVIIDISKNNETSADLNNTVTDIVGTDLTSGDAAPITTTFAPGVTDTDAPLNNQCTGRTGVALLCASVLGAIISAFV
jgi:hypothetical protein